MRDGLQGDLERAATAFGEALTLARQIGDGGDVALCLLNLSWVARLRGETDQAEALQRQALALGWELGDPRRCAEALEYLAATAGTAGKGYQAARILGAARAVREAIGAPPPPEDQEDLERAVAGARAALGKESWTAAYGAGQRLTLEEVVAEVLGAAHA